MWQRKRKEIGQNTGRETKTIDIYYKRVTWCEQNGTWTAWRRCRDISTPPSIRFLLKVGSKADPNAREKQISMCKVILQYFFQKAIKTCKTSLSYLIITLLLIIIKKMTICFARPNTNAQQALYYRNVIELSRNIRNYTRKIILIEMSETIYIILTMQMASWQLTKTTSYRCGKTCRHHSFSNRTHYHRPNPTKHL